MMSAAEAPSVSGEELPGVMCQPISGNCAAYASSWKAERRPARPSAVVEARTVSSTVWTEPSGSVTGTISSANAPSEPNAAARSWDRAEKASRSSRVSFHRAAISSAPMPWWGSPSG